MTDRSTNQVNYILDIHIPKESLLQKNTTIYLEQQPRKSRFLNSVTDRQTKKVVTPLVMSGTLILSPLSEAANTKFVDKKSDKIESILKRVI